MYAISSDNDRRPSHPGPERPELPILFHLMDVSRPRITPEETLGEQLPAEKPKSAELFSSLTPAVVKPVDAGQIARTSEIKPSPAPAEAALRSDALDAEVVEPLHKSIAAVTDAAAQKTVAAASVETSAETVSSESRKPASDPTTAVTLKARPTERRQRKTPLSEDWFASHGKFIAIAFVVALIGTVYFARTNRQQATPDKQDAAQSPLVDLQPAAPTTESTAPRVQTVAAVSDSKVELQPPSAPPLIASAPEDKPAGADKLFDFPAPPPAAAKSEQRVAARPVSAAEVITNTKREESAAPSAAPALSSAYPVANSPAAYPSTATAPSAYPQTSGLAVQGPAVQGPAFQAPANVPPTYRNQYPAPSIQQTAPPQPGPQQYAPQQPALPQAGPGGSWSPPTSMNGGGQYQPIDNTARGPRYERTGSGRY